MTLCYLALGSNLGDREAYLALAREELEARGARILRESTVHETEPFGVVDQPLFLNQVLEVDWEGSPRDLLLAAKAVETAVGRQPTYRWGPREIDVDILMVLAALGAAYVGAPFEGAMLLFLFSLSNLLQDLAISRTISLKG